MQLITGFETFLKKQKTESDEMSKFSDTNLKKVKHDTATQSQVEGYSVHVLSPVAAFFQFAYNIV